METKKPMNIPMLILVIVLGLVLAGVVMLALNYHLVDFKLYPRDAAELDLRGQEITPSHYGKLIQLLPDCQIHWDVPFQGKSLDNDTEEVTVSQGDFTQEDALALTYLPKLKTVHAEEHEDYQMMAAVQQSLPQVQVLYTVDIGGTKISSTDEAAVLGTVPQEELEKLDYLPQLKTVAARGADAGMLQSYCASRGLGFALDFHGNLIDANAQEVQIEGLLDSEVSQLANLKHMKKLHLVSPQADPEAIFSLEEALPGTDVTWEVYVGEEMYHSIWVDEELNLSGLENLDLEELKQSLSYLPRVEKVFLGEPGIANDELAAYRDQVRDQYKVVWEIRLGDSKPIRTDITYFFPGRDCHIYNVTFNDSTSHNLRYCEDLICVDVGHLGVHDTSFLEGLVNLEYLILAHTGVTHVDGIENCKKLKFLELDWTGIRTLEPLKGLTALEDLNIGNTYPDVSALKEMPWLKNIYMIYGDGGDAWELRQALPDTNVVSSGNATVGSGWRKLPNYYAMRDALNAPYMDG